MDTGLEVLVSLSQELGIGAHAASDAAAGEDRT